MTVQAILITFVTGTLLLGAQPPGWHPLKSKNKKVKKGNKQYSAQNYDDALESYGKAALMLPDEPGVHLDRGAALFKKGTSGQERDDATLDMASGAFSDAIALAGEDQSDLKADAFYDMGNVKLAQERWEDAIAAFRQALKLRPGFDDAAFNLALALKKLEEQKRKEEEEKQQKEKQQQEQEQQQEKQEQEQQQEKQDQEQCDGGAGKDDEQEKEQSDENQEKQQEEQQQQQQQQQQQEKEQGGGQEQQGGEEQAMQEPVPLTQQEAEAILDALQRGEKNLELEKLEDYQGNGQAKPKVNKDW